MMASIGSFHSASKTALRGVNHSRSLWRARARRKARPSGRRWAAATGFVARVMMETSLPDHLQRAAEEAVEVGGEGFVLGDSLFDGLLSCYALVAEIDQRGKHVVHRGSAHGRWRGRHGKVVELVFEFDHQPLGQLLADAGNARQLRMVLAANGLHGALRREAAQHLDRQFGTDAADYDQPLEEALLFAIEEAKEGDLVLADLGVNVQRGLCAQRGQRREGGDGDSDVIAHPGGLDDGLAGLFVDELSA